MSILLDVDSYKLSHFRQYPPGTTHVSSYIEARGGPFDNAVFLGPQAWIKKNLLTPITNGDRDEWEMIARAHGFEPNVAGVDRIIKKHGGFLPVTIEAAPEGAVIPTRNVLSQVVNTDPELPWLTSYLETSYLRAIWYPTTVASLSRKAKELIYASLVRSSDDPDGQIAFKLHDFGARGATSEEAAGLGGMAHLVNFMGTDTISGLMTARRYYQADMPGFSIPAAEHSTITAWGKESEVDAYRNMLSQFGGAGKLVAVVSDSYDIYHAVDVLWGGELRSEVMSMGGTLVIRPDSGDPTTMPIEVIKRLMKTFGSTTNSKGYHVLPSCVRVIQGDGINLASLETILANLEAEMISTDNIAFGMGAGLLQKVDRDTMQFAMKASAVKQNGVWREVYKDPISDHRKASKRGRLALVYQCGIGSCGYRTVSEDYASTLNQDDVVMRPIYQNGELLVDDSFATIRERAQL